MRHTPHLRSSLVVVAATLVLASCATTVEDSAEVAVDSVPSTTAAPFTVPEGPASELLPTLLREMTGLSALIGPAAGPDADAPRDDPDDRIVEIEAIWSAARSEVEANDPLIALQLDDLVALSRVAVERNRPADADKAARFASDVVAAYLGS